jgi:hypothetical protein
MKGNLFWVSAVEENVPARKAPELVLRGWKGFVQHRTKELKCECEEVCIPLQGRMILLACLEQVCCWENLRIQIERDLENECRNMHTWSKVACKVWNKDAEKLALFFFSIIFFLFDDSVFCLFNRNPQRGKAKTLFPLKSLCPY